MKRPVFFILALLLAGGCVSVPRTNPIDSSRYKAVEAVGLHLRLPANFKRFTENEAVVFRPEPPERPSAGVLIKPETGENVETILNRAYLDLTQKMDAAPLVVEYEIAGARRVGLHDEMATHFVWVYVLKDEARCWSIQIVAPIDWTDEQVIAFHDLVLGSVTIETE